MSQNVIHWDSSGQAVRGAICELCGWITNGTRAKPGHLSMTGRKIVKQSWETMSPAARNVLTRAGVQQ